MFSPSKVEKDSVELFKRREKDDQDTGRIADTWNKVQESSTNKISSTLWLSFLQLYIYVLVSLPHIVCLYTDFFPVNENKGRMISLFDHDQGVYRWKEGTDGVLENVVTKIVFLQRRKNIKEQKKAQTKCF